MKTRFALAPGVHGVEHAHTNCYVLTDDTGVTLVDACFPSTYSTVLTVLHDIGRRVEDVRALLLTHGHFDHVGFARRVREQLQVPVWVHEADRRLASHPYRYRPQRNRALYPLTHPRSLPVLASMVAAGALTVRGVEADRTFAGGDELPVPARPRVVHVPGHTAGSVAFVLPDTGTVLSGDALVTLDPYTGRTGPRLVAPAATADVEQATASLDRLRGLASGLVLPGHGDPWTGGVDAAVAAARAASGSERGY